MKMKKILLTILLAICLCAFFSAAACADGDGFNAYLNVTRNDDGSLTVVIPEENAAILAQQTPTLSIPCAIDYAVVTKDGETVPSSCENGQVSFVVAEPGTYVIAEGPRSSFAAYSTDASCTGSVSNIDVDKAVVQVGETVTLTARDTLGYRFLGWYSVTGTENGLVSSYGDLLSGSLTYTLVAEENTAVAAVYEANAETVAVTIHATNGAQYRVDGDSAVHEGSMISRKRGDTLRLTAVEPDRVLQWQNESQKRLGGGEELVFTVTGATSVTLVYQPAASESQSFVQYVSDYGQVLFASPITADSVFTPPSVPTKFGYRSLGWVFEGTDELATVDAIRSRIGAEHPLITLKPSYELEQQEAAVEVTYVNGLTGQVLASESHSAQIGAPLSLQARSFDALRFDRWENSAGTVLGYKTGYYLQVTGDAQLRAVYLSSDSAAQVKPVITLGPATAVTDDSVHKVSCSATRSIPAGYTLVEHGFLYAKGMPELTTDSFVYGTEGVKRFVSNATASNGVVKLNVKVTGDNADDLLVSFRGYMLLRDEATGTESYYYTDIVSASYSSLAP